MSAGGFVGATYTLDGGSSLPARIQPETITSFNPDGTGTIIAGVGRIKLSSGRREFGVSPRTVTASWTTAPAGYKAGGSVRIPIFTPTAFAAITLNQVLTYLGGTCKVTGKNPEKEN